MGSGPEGGVAFHSFLSVPVGRDAEGPVDGENGRERDKIEVERKRERREDKSWKTDL